MALDPRISLAGQVVDAGAAVAQGQQTGERFKTQGIREQILNNQAQTGAMNNAKTQGQYLNQLATGLKSKPLDERAAIMAQQLPLLTQMGLNPADIISGGLSDTDLDGVITKTQPFMQQAGGTSTAAQSDFEYFQGVASNPNSTDDQVRAAKIALGTEANQGRTSLRETAVSGVFQVFDPNKNTLSNPMKRDVEGNLVELTRQEMLDTGLAEQVEEITTVGEAKTEVDVEKAKRLAEVELDKELKATDMKDLRVRRQAFINNGAAAKDSIGNINRMIAINDRVITGGATAVTKAVTDWLGTTPGDLGEFNRASGELVLSTIRQLGANPTEGERSFLEKIQPSVGQSGEVNAAILKDLLRIAERQVDRAKRLQADPSLDPNEMILNEPEFVGEFTGGGGSTGTQANIQPTTTTPIDSTGSFDNDAYVDSLFN